MERDDILAKVRSCHGTMWVTSWTALQGRYKMDDVRW